MNRAPNGMTAVAGRTPGPLPWPPLIGATAAAAAVVGLATARGGVSGLAVQVAGLALAAGAAYLLDDPAAAVTVTVPRSLWRRRSATVVRGLAVLTATWTVLLVLPRRGGDGLDDPAVTVQTAGVALLALAAAAVLARRGTPEPGNLVAPAVALVGIGALLLQPMLGVTLFVGADRPPDNWLSWWVGVVIGMLLVLLAAWRDPAARFRVRRR